MGVKPRGRAVLLIRWFVVLYGEVGSYQAHAHTNDGVCSSAYGDCRLEYHTVDIGQTTLRISTRWSMGPKRKVLEILVDAWVAFELGSLAALSHTMCFLLLSGRPAETWRVAASTLPARRMLSRGDADSPSGDCNSVTYRIPLAEAQGSGRI